MMMMSGASSSRLLVIKSSWSRSNTITLRSFYSARGQGLTSTLPAITTTATTPHPLTSSNVAVPPGFQQNQFIYHRSGAGCIRFLSDTKPPSPEEAAEPTTQDNATTTESAEAPSASDDSAGAAASEPQQPSREKVLEIEVKELKDQLLRSLAEQENTRRIAKRDVEEARNYAIKTFAKSLLDVSDNLTRALEAVPEDFRADKEKHTVLATLYEGIQLTDQELKKAFERNGLAKYGQIGEVFDPNLHEALYEYPDATKKAGTIGQVMKPGFTLHRRVLRPAEVGVIKKT